MKASTSCRLPAIKFGTDGWRAVTADQFTFANLERVTQAYCAHLQQQAADSTKKLSVIIGYDNRFLADRFAKHTSQILSGNGIIAHLLPQAVHTPLVSFAVINQQATGGLMLTASHNPAEYSGFKIKENWGGSAFESTTKAVEALLDSQPLKIADNTPCHTDFPALQKAYDDHISNIIDVEKIQAAGLNVTIDSMHGTGSRLIEKFIQGKNTKHGKNTRANTIRADRDCLFGNVAPEPIDKNLEALKASVKRHNCHIGLATDGDGDRLGAVNELGETMTMHQVAPLLLLHLARNRKESGAVIATVTQSVLMRRIAEACGLAYEETPVGFKYIARQMLDGDVLIGAEESGGIGIKGHIPERDGVFNALLLLEALAESGKSASQYVADLHHEFGAFYYDRLDLHLPTNVGERFLTDLSKNPPKQLAEKPLKNVLTIDGVKLILADGSWLMFRQSGTEPVLRVYAEGASKQLTAQLLQQANELLATSNH